MRLCKSTRLAVLSAAATVALGASSSFAVPLVTYNFNNLPTTGNSDVGAAPSSMNAMVSSTNLTANAAGFQAVAPGTTAGNYAFYSTSGSPTPINGGTAAPNPNGSFGHQATTTPDSVAGAFSNQTYYSFTLTPTGGATGFSFGAGDSLTFQETVRNNSNGNSTYTDNVALTSSKTGFAQANILGTSTQGLTSPAGSYVSKSIPLGGIGTVTGPLTIRLYLYDSPAGSTSANDSKFDNLVLNGSTVVPEPASLGLLGLGGLALLRRRRTGR